MLHLQVREARIAHGLTQAKLARLADVPRTRLREFEEGGNITLETLKKILGQLPNLRTVNLGTVEIQTASIDPTAARQILIDLITAAGRALSLFEAAAPAPARVPIPEPTPAEPAPDSEGARRFEGGMEISAGLEQRLRALEAAVRPVDKDRDN